MRPGQYTFIKLLKLPGILDFLNYIHPTVNIFSAGITLPGYLWSPIHPQVYQPPTQVVQIEDFLDFFIENM